MVTQETRRLETSSDPICGMTVDPATAAGSYMHNGETFYFCSKGCMQKFIAQSEGVQAGVPVQIGRAKSSDHESMHSSARGSQTDPVCGMSVDPASAAAEYEYQGKKYYFCAVRCKERFAADPEGFLAPPSESAAGSKSAIPNPQSQIEYHFTANLNGATVAWASGL